MTQTASNAANNNTQTLFEYYSGMPDCWCTQAIHQSDAPDYYSAMGKSCEGWRPGSMVRRQRPALGQWRLNSNTNRLFECICFFFGGEKMLHVDTFATHQWHCLFVLARMQMHPTDRSATCMWLLSYALLVRHIGIGGGWGVGYTNSQHCHKQQYINIV